MAEPKLIAKRHHGADALFFSEDTIVLCIHPEGDCDTIPWPMKSEHRSEAQIHAHLRSALYDARETGDLPADTRAVILPDGTKFEIAS